MEVPHPKAVVHAREDSEIEFSRIVAFSDGVFAIAITLLVLALEVPAASDLGEELKDRGNEFFAYFLSFAVVGRMWMAHHRVFGAIGRFDNTLVALNVLYLAFVALIPFTSEVLGDYSDESLGVALYAANIATCAACSQVLIRYAYRNGLMRDDAALYRGRYAGRASLALSLIFAISIPVAFLSPTAATLMWLSVFVFGERLADRAAGLRRSA